MKEDSEVAQEEEDDAQAEVEAPEGSSLVEKSELRAQMQIGQDFEENPNIRVCIVNCDKDLSMFERVPVDIFSNTIGDLTELLKKEFGVEGPHRIRNLERDRLYAKEEIGMMLKNFDQFTEGGSRLTLETGEYCSITEVAVKILYEDQ